MKEVIIWLKILGMTAVLPAAMLALLPIGCEFDQRGRIERSCRQDDCNHLVEGELKTFHQCVKTCKAKAIKRRRREGREDFPLWVEE